MKFLVFISIVVLLLASCVFGNRYYEEDGISFQIPEGFRVTESTKLDNGNFFLSIEPKRKNEDGIILFAWEQDSVDLYSNLKHYLKYLEDGYNEEDMAIPIFDRIDTVTFAGREALVAINETGIGSSGGNRYWTFNCYYTTVLVSVAYDEIKYEEIEKSLQVVEKSFKCFNK